MSETMLPTDKITTKKVCRCQKVWIYIKDSIYLIPIVIKFEVKCALMGQTIYRNQIE